MRISPIFTATTLGVLLLGQVALAQQTPPTPEQREARFVAADANKDGKLDKAEWTATLPERAVEFADMLWSQIDEDGDGSVTKEQFVAFRMRRPG
jgi:Ca2+-binding EF-hand superfamily protein